MKKYKFRVSDTNFITFSKESFDSFKDVVYTDDKGKGKIIPVKREDGQFFQIIAPLELIEEITE